jgi:rubrerythrin
VEDIMTLPTTLDPWRERGIPLEQQFRSWKQRIKTPYHKLDVDPYTRVRVILMNGIENECWAYSHHFARCTGNPEIKALLARTRMVEQQQQTTINWLNPADQTILETTLAFEQVAIDLTAYLARHEPDPYLREVLNFGLLEDFDHLYRYSELLDYLEGTDPNSILQGATEVLPGRPTEHHHNDPEVRLRKHYEKNRALPVSKLHVLTLLSGEQQTYLYYKSHGFMYENPRARELYAEIAEVEEEHVSMYESLIDPTETLLERQVLHQLMEVYNYYHCYTHESDPRIREIWDEFLHMELTHLQLWGELLRKYQGVDPEALFGSSLQVDFKFQENKEYVRHVLDQQRQVRLLDHGWTMIQDLPSDWLSHHYKQIVNADGIPSEEIVDFQVDRGRPGDDLLQRARQLALQFRQEDR